MKERKIRGQRCYRLRAMVDGMGHAGQWALQKLSSIISAARLDLGFDPATHENSG
jgi:hypothetical protein